MSEEQLAIAHCCGDLYNVMVDAVAGSGKSTTTKLIATTHPEQSVLSMTFSAALKMEGRKDAPPNLEVQSFHSMCLAMYGQGQTDYEVHEVVQADVAPKKKKVCDIMVIDEAQDITPLIFKFLKKLYKDLVAVAETPEKWPRLVVMGDQMQTIFGYQGADSRYLTCADICFNWNGYGWKKCRLTESFRVSTECANFINRCLLSSDRIRSNKHTSVLPRYITIPDMFKPEELYKEIEHYLCSGYTYNDIFILACSVKGGKGFKMTPVQKLTNLLSRRRVPIIVGDELTPECIANKVVVSTFHKVKGMERPVTIVIGADAFYTKREDDITCPNTIYMACTRATQCLSVIQASKSGPMPCLNLKLLPVYATRKGPGLKQTYKSVVNNNIRKKFTIQELTKHLQYEQVLDALSRFEFRTTKPLQSLQSPQVIQGESVCDLNPIIIALHYCNASTNVLTEATQILSSQTGYYHKQRQLDVSVNWLETESRLQRGADRLRKAGIVQDRTLFFQEHFNSDKTIGGIVDYCDEKQLFKFVMKDGALTHDDTVQLIPLAYLLPHCEFYTMYNIETNEQITMVNPRGGQRDCIECFMQQRRPVKMSDEQFIYQCCR